MFHRERPAFAYCTLPNASLRRWLVAAVFPPIYCHPCFLAAVRINERRSKQCSAPSFCSAPCGCRLQVPSSRCLQQYQPTLLSIGACMRSSIYANSTYNCLCSASVFTVVYHSSRDLSTSHGSLTYGKQQTNKPFSRQ